MLHGKITRQERDAVMREFKRGELVHLVNTNLLARGIDIPEISLVINFSLPKKPTAKPSDPQVLDPANYTHRVGRCTRWNKKGLVINIISQEEIPELKEIEKSNAATANIRNAFKIEELQVEEIESLDERLMKFRKEETKIEETKKEGTQKEGTQTADSAS